MYDHLHTIEPFSCWANAEFFTFSLNISSKVPTSNRKHSEAEVSAKAILYGNMH